MHTRVTKRLSESAVLIFVFACVCVCVWIESVLLLLCFSLERKTYLHKMYSSEGEGGGKLILTKRNNLNRQVDR